MADNKVIDNGELTDFTIATDEIGGLDFQIVKIAHGADGTADNVTAAAPFPVTAVTELNEVDYDTGGATANQAVVGIVVPASGGAVAVPGDATDGLKVQVSTGPAAARTGDSISAALAVDRLMNNLTQVTPVNVVIDHAVSGDNTIVSAQGASNIILVHQVFLVAASAVTIRFESGTGGTALTGQIQLSANSGFVLPFSPVGWFKTAANTLLNLELSGAISVDGGLTYTVVT